MQIGDIVTIFGVSDLPVPAEKSTQILCMEGRVMVPRICQIQIDDTLPETIHRAGDVSRNGFLSSTVFTRESTCKQHQTNLDKSIRQMESYVKVQAATALQNVVDTEKGSAIQSQLAGQRLLLVRVQNLKVAGRILLDMNANSPALPSLSLKGEDTILAPAQPSFIGMFGEVYAKHSFIYKARSTVSDYPDKAGVTSEADLSALILIRYNGSVESAARSGGTA